MSISKAIKKIVKENPSITNAKLTAYLTIDDYTNKEIKEAFKAEGRTTDKPKTFASEYYNFLAEAKRTEAEATDYIMGLGEYGETSANVQKHRSHYLSIHGLSVAIFNAK